MNHLFIFSDNYGCKQPKHVAELNNGPIYC